VDDPNPPAFSLTSTEASARLELHAVEDADRSYRATVHSSAGLEASVHVGISRTAFASYFKGFARDWRGWDGERTYIALRPGEDYGGGALRLTAVADGRGHVVIAVELGHPWVWTREADVHETHVGFPPPTQPGTWSARALLQLEAGQLDEVAAQADTLPQDSRGRW
jgi:Family of unknown function (DUF6228)